MLHYWEQEESGKLQVKLDEEQYNKEDLVEVKIPINLPYHSNWKEFERFDGEVDINGVHYRYVMRKIYNDSLVLLCIPNQVKNKVQAVQDQFAGLVTDLQKNPAQQKSKKTSSFPSFTFVTDYLLQQSVSWNAAITVIQPVYGRDAVVSVINFAVGCPWHPPDPIS